MHQQFKIISFTAFYNKKSLTLFLGGYSSFQDLESLPSDLPLFTSLAERTHPDCLLFDGQSPLTTENVRSIDNQMKRTTLLGEKRAVLIEDVQRLNLYGLNALLKNLEEPPPHTTYFLTATSKSALPATIRSRCHVLSMHPLSKNEFSQAIEAFKLQSSLIETIDTNTLYTYAQGFLGRALYLLQDERLSLTKLYYEILTKHLLRTPDRFDALEKLTLPQENPILWLQETFFLWLQHTFLYPFKTPNSIDKQTEALGTDKLLGWEGEEKIQCIETLFRDALVFNLSAKHVFECTLGILSAPQ